MQPSPKRGADIVPDFSLWDEISKTAVPIHPRKTKLVAGAKPQREGRALEAAKSPARNTPTQKQGTPPAPASRYELTGLDRRTAQKLTRGKHAIDASIDLHGMGAEEARQRLLRFLATARLHGHRTILVITGKGASPYGSSTRAACAASCRNGSRKPNFAGM
jgi:DNA-nicking Smr family endonuclease